MAQNGLTWVKPPSTLADGIQRYGERALQAVYAAAAYVGQRMQNEARQRAPWEDRTGNARSGLFFAVDGFGFAPSVGQWSTSDPNPMRGDRAVLSGTTDRMILVLGHTMWYGKFLELSNGGRYAVVMSTMERNLPGLERMLKEVFNG